MPAQTVSHEAYPLHLRAIDRGVGLLDRAGLFPWARLDPDEIMAEARRVSGLDDFGGTDFLEPMKLVIDNASNLRFTHLARVIVRSTYVKALRNRLEVRQYLKAHPHVRDTRIDRPIFILGFPRTGTTLLQNLMATSPAQRGLRFWELMSPVPTGLPPEQDRAKRMRTARVALAATRVMAPEMAAVHDVRPTSYEECWYLFMPSFAVLNWDIQTGLADYGRWLLQHDMRGPYEEYRTWLEVLLQNESADHLLLKCPEHLWFLDALLEVFPDACIVWTHRDPVASIASYCSLMSLPKRMLFGHFEPRSVGKQITRQFHEGVTRAMAARAKADPARFYDVDFLRLVREPKQVVHDIHRHFGIDEAPDLDACMDTFFEQDREDDRGQHVYSAERFGVDAEEIYETYADYIRHFDIPIRQEDV